VIRRPLGWRWGTGGVLREARLYLRIIEGGRECRVVRCDDCVRGTARRHERVPDLEIEAGLPCGEEANMGKMLAADAAWAAGEACIQTFGGFGFAEEYDIERKYREARLYQVAPISTNLILSYIGEHVLGMPRSY